MRRKTIPVELFYTLRRAPLLKRIKPSQNKKPRSTSLRGSLRKLTIIAYAEAFAPACNTSSTLW